VSATLRLTREGVGIELIRGQFEIAVDGKSVGSVKYGETVETPIEPGRHALRLRGGRCSSREYSFDAAEGGIVTFRCHGAMVWPCPSLNRTWGSRSSGKEAGGTER